MIMRVSHYDAVDAVRQLKLKRSARCGAITRYFNTHNKIALSDICPSEVQSKLEKVKDLVQEHELYRRE